MTEDKMEVIDTQVIDEEIPQAKPERKPKTMEEELNPEGVKRVQWAAFVESDIVNFFDLHELEKLSLEDGKGNKAKLSRIKDNGIKVEHSSTTIL